MSKWFEVKIEIWKTVMVEVQDDEGEEQALEVATGELLSGKDGQATAKEVTGEEEIDRSRRHADDEFKL